MSDLEKIKKTQVFTPEWVTNDMLNLLGEEKLIDPDVFFFEPSCGQGDMLKVLLDRIFNAQMNLMNDDEYSLCESLSRFYAIDIDPEMITKCRINIYNWAVSKLEKKSTQLEKRLIASFVISRIENRNFFEVFQHEKMQKLR